ncbi:hypothetical protein FRUB_03796 [Fimbriiglobus ruber]|uniref:Uncharacterized protein n=1 Tax=Fimbriiglobus ruber TaxID=1908690 RepID=A0A225DT42_9BACT|nr:hypothetical protein FRUB_03796 [Fimbriiglobus ruber]
MWFRRRWGCGGSGLWLSGSCNRRLRGRCGWSLPDGGQGATDQSQSRNHRTHGVSLMRGSVWHVTSHLGGGSHFKLHLRTTFQLGR